MPINPEMDLRREKPPPAGGEDTSGRDALQGEEARAAFSEEDWGKAQQRLILYLQFLKVPPFEALELALEALKRARLSPELDADNPPITAALRALRQLLTQRPPAHGGDRTPSAELKPAVRQPHGGREDDISRGVKSMPRLNRGSMLPKGSR
jgi:hypothetical protein